ncbi:MAG: Crp/Fnr family transcriptional regulator [Marinobacter sp.]|nr:Crp/Fnr family transcriptional regulator [Marinobacter sp.]
MAAPIPGDGSEPGQSGAGPLNCLAPQRHNSFTETQKPGHLRLVTDGHIELLERTGSGEEASVAMLGPGSWVTWLGCFDDRPSHYDFYSSANCTAIAIPSSRVRQVADKCPILYRLVIGAIGDRFRLLMEWTTSSALLDQERRIAKLLYMLSRLNTDLSPSPTIHYTQDKLAVLARCTRQTVSLSLKKLEHMGLIVQKYKRIEIVRPDRLKAFSEVEATSPGEERGL